MKRSRLPPEAHQCLALQLGWRVSRRAPGPVSVAVANWLREDGQTSPLATARQALRLPSLTPKRLSAGDLICSCWRAGRVTERPRRCAAMRQRAKQASHQHSLQPGGSGGEAHVPGGASLGPATGQPSPPGLTPGVVLQMEPQRVGAPAARAGRPQ